MCDYKNIDKKAPEEAAAIVGVVKKNNYLAHSIREIERAILTTHGFNYHIITYESECKTARIYFFDRSSVIRLPLGCEDMEDKTIRLILAHELGHLVRKFPQLKTLEIISTAPAKLEDEEEIYCWVFAYYLIKKKSDEYRKNMGGQKYIYSADELRRSLISTVRKSRPDIVGAVEKALLESEQRISANIGNENKQ